MDYTNKRELLLKQIILVGGAWQSAGCKDEYLEKEVELLICQLHPVRKMALDILYRHLEVGVAA